MRVQGNIIPQSVVIEDSPKQGYSVVRISNNAEQIKDNLYEYDEYVFTVPSKYADIESITANFAEWVASGESSELNHNASELYYQQQIINVATSYLDDDEALTVIPLFAEWKPDEWLEIGDRRQYGGRLYKVRQNHTSQSDWTPDITPALYELIDVEHKGTIDDPIPFDLGMAIENGKYYTQFDVEYLCIRDSINPLYNNLADLIGIYVEVVNE